MPQNKELAFIAKLLVLLNLSTLGNIMAEWLVYFAKLEIYHLLHIALVMLLVLRRTNMEGLILPPTCMLDVSELNIFLTWL